jgi:UDP-N-acetyl-D-mannosaminuronic acid dehydrogenase
VDDYHAPVYDSFTDACHEVGKYLRRGSTVIIESTVAPGTTLNVARPILEQESGLTAALPEGFGLAFSCERVMVGKLFRNIRHLPKIVGGIDQASTDAAKELYASVVREQIYTSDILTAEVAKTVENAYRDVQIAFANEVALISESLHVDVHDVRALVNSLPDRHMLLPGAGVGGHCLPKDSWLLLGAARSKHISVIARARIVNDGMPRHIARLLTQALTEAGRSNPTVCMLGYAYLENSDDDRHSPTASLLDILKFRRVQYVVHDPHVRNDWVERDLGTALRDADAVVLMTAHDEYKAITPEYLAGLMRTKLVIDGRNVWNSQDFIDKGFIFRGVGKGNILKGVKQT